MHRTAVIGIALVFASVLGQGIQAQQVEAGELTLDPTGRVQVQYNSTSVDPDALGLGVDEPAAAAFETRRIRLGANLAYGDWITGKVEADLSKATASLKDGWVNVALADAFELRAGQFKKPFSLIELTSSTKIPVIERGERIRELGAAVASAGGSAVGEEYLLLDDGGYVGRDIGVMAHGSVGGLGYAVGTYNGEGANRAEALGSKAYAGRVTYAPLDPLTVGAGLSVQPTGVQGADGEVEGTAWSVDAEWGEFRGGGLWVVAEVMGGDNALLAGPAMPSMLGAQAMGGWFLARDGRVEGLEPALRLSWGDPDTDADGDEGVLVTPGLNLYFSGRNRLMFNGDVYFPGQAGLDAQFALRAQMQIYF